MYVVSVTINWESIHLLPPRENCYGFPSGVAFFDDSCDEFPVTFFTSERGDREGLHDIIIYPPSPKGGGEPA